MPKVTSRVASAANVRTTAKANLGAVLVRTVSVTSHRLPSLRATAGTHWMHRLFLASVSVTALTVLSAGSAAAQTNWTGAASSDWTNGANWSGGVVPTVGNNVGIDTLSSNPTVLGVGGAVSGTTANLFIGTPGGTGSLTIQNGSTLTSNGLIRIGQGLGGTGVLTVTGTGSQWTTSVGLLIVGLSGTGTLNIQDGGQVTAQAGIRLGNNSAGSGTLNISNGGALATTVLNKGSGAGQANFDNGILRATTNSPSGFITGFAGSQLNLAAGGLTVDTAGFTIGTDTTSGFSGVGGLTVTGGGIFNLAANNTYTGATVINAGSTLALLGVGSVASSSRVVANGTFDASGISGAGTNIRSLGGSGLVTLGTKNLTITNANDVFSGTLSGTGALTIAGGMQTLSGNNAGYTSLTTVQGGTLAVNGVLGGPINVLSAGRLQGIGTVGDTTNAGVIAPGNSIGTLTIAGNYTGNGGTLQIESALGGDSSPTDKLVVTGNTAGSTFVRVTNVGGTGAQTVEGIKIVDVGGASNGTFTLQGDYVIQGQQAVVGGAYAYTLQKNGVATPADGDWYLRSSLINPPPAAPAGPLYQPGVPLYESYGQILLGMNGLSTFRQRVGDRYSGAGDVAAPSSVRAPSPIWARVEGQHTKMTPSNTTGSTYTADQMKLQSGFDGLAFTNHLGQLIFGVSAHYTTLTSDIKSFYGNGKINVEGAGLGASLTWFGDNGFYVDGQSQVTWYKSDLSSDLAGTVAGNKLGYGYAVGAEGGRRVALGGNFSLTPQAQLTYSSVNFDSFTDRFGAVVSNDRARSLLGRAGLSLDHQRVAQDNDGRVARSDIYGIANLYYEFLNGTAVDVSGTKFASATDRLWGGVGVGGNYRWAGDKYAVYGEVSFNTSLADAGDNYAYKGTVGFRAKW